MIAKGSAVIGRIFKGSSQIGKVYKGGILVYQYAVADGYWIHKDTGVKTDFGLEESCIVDGEMKTPAWIRDAKEVKIPTGVTKIGANAFAYSGLDSIALPATLVEIGPEAFYSLSQPVRLEFNEGLEIIGNSAFYYGPINTDILVFPESLKIIGDSSFSSVNYNAIILGERIEKIGALAFMSFFGSTNPYSVICKALAPPSIKDYSFARAPAVIRVPSSSVNAYKMAPGWSVYENIIEAIP